MIEIPTLELFRSKEESSVTWGTFSRVLLNGAPFCVAVERPWLNNASQVSCIPAGTYIAKPDYSPKRGHEVYELQGVPQRSEIQIHIANFAYQLHGCIALGREVAMIKDSHDGTMKKGVTSSGTTIGLFMKAMTTKGKLAPEIKVIIHPDA